MGKRIPVVAVVVPSYGAFPQITSTIKNATRSLKSNRVNPFFIVAHNKEIPKRIRASVLALGEKVEFLPVQGEGLGNSMIAGFDSAAKRADVVTMLPDDFDFEAREFFKTVRPTLEGKLDFVNSNWPYSDMRFAASFPKPQYLNEMVVSRLVTLARPDFHPKTMQLMPALKQAEREGKLLQTYTGLLSIKAKQWPKVKQTMQSLFYNKAREIDSWAFEQAILLASMHSGLKVGTVSAPRIFEHKWPTEKTIETVRQKRTLQFDVATAIIREFLEKTRQTEKLTLFDQVVAQTKKRIETARAGQSMDAWNKLAKMRKLRKFRNRFPAIRKK